MALQLDEVLLAHVLLLRIREQPYHLGKAWRNRLLNLCRHQDGDDSKSANLVPVVGLPINCQEEPVEDGTSRKESFNLVVLLGVKIEDLLDRKRPVVLGYLFVGVNVRSRT